MSETPTENMDNNPYQPPSADLSISQKMALELHPPRSTPFGAGWQWLSGAFELFKLNAGLWIGMFIVYIVIMIAASLVPFSNLLLGFFGPIFNAGFMMACYKADYHNEARFSDMFSGFSQRFGSLALLGGIYVILTILLFVILGLFIYLIANEQMVSVFTAMAFDEAPTEDILTILPTLLLVIPFSFLIWTPLIMAYWFAPALVMLNEQEPWTAMKLSFSGCLKNILPFLLYGIAFIILAILASIPVGLGWLVLGPMMFISVYKAYKSIYLS